MKPEIKKDLLEKLSELEHIQWLSWSKAVWDRLESIKRAIEEEDKRKALFLLEEQRNRWGVNWIPYNKLDEETKEMDRKYARKVIKIIYGGLK